MLHGRRGFLHPVDKELAGKEAQSAKRKQEEQIRAEEAKVSDSAALACYGEYVSTSSLESVNTELREQHSSSTMQSPMKRRCTITGAKNLISPSLAHAQDRTKVSNRAAVHIIAATVESLGHSVEELTINRKIIHQPRRTLRQKAAASVEDNFSLYILDCEVNAVVHWDGKLLPDTAGCQNKYDRLPVLVSYGGPKKLLAVSKLTSGSRKSMALAVKEALNDGNQETKLSQ